MNRQVSIRKAPLVELAAFLLLFIVFVIYPACGSPPATLPPASVSSSALMVALTVDQLIADAGYIVTGTVMAKESRRDSPDSSIYTFVTIKITEVLKGQLAADSITIRVPGGEVNGIAMIAEDTPEFILKENVLVFLAPGDVSKMTVTGGMQGKGTIDGGRVTCLSPSLNGLLVTDLKSKIASRQGQTNR